MPVKSVIGGKAPFRRAVLAHAATSTLVDAGLRARHPVHATPEVAVRIEHETTSGVSATTRETQGEGEIVRLVDEIEHERRTAAPIRCRQSSAVLKTHAEQ